MIRAGMTVVMFLVFVGIVWWAYGPARRRRFEEDARIALDDDQPPHGREPGRRAQG
ncbi:MAG: cbb3-type cytochrome c oxidase subunit 3 [Rhodocyclaceae bacterium]|nr:cbb3-type cytochrome c oxidase subunit 3 [Rhodocyclaceae bacterium]MCA3134339.1 cbb3-type cytochrome c oxidase subunit 3 [Rhodocyclaceae bacterium]MCA3141198.1 cbb3-type cytochrome c oxidase subunit 3 [Rhodocyclaceae bacterium]MCA3145097.1 cbb3-type cytochrome c oxidase subunit 3 [Rhodocyclaceae bacterium]MCA6261353.1 cbb3-type cytochrome c oxidase subunit 3 [Phenylobacterium sp.]